MSADSHTAVLNSFVLDKAQRFEHSLRQGLGQMTRIEKWMTLIGVSLATSIGLGTEVAINVILPDMKGNVAASQDQISWVIIVYSAAFFAILPLTDWFARKLGHRNYLVASLFLYSTGALGCFLSHSIWELLAARVVMGVGGGAFLVRALISLYRLYDERHRFFALFTFATFVTSSRALFPVLFGAVTDYRTWNIAFLVLVPLALLAAALLYLGLPQRLEFAPHPPRADAIGATLIVVGLVAFQVVMSRGEQDMWLQSNLIRFMAIVCLVCLAAFVWWDTRPANSNPLLNLRLLAAERDLASGIALALILGALLAAGLYLLPQYLREVQGYSATKVSWFFCVDGFATLCGIVTAAKLTPKITARVVLLSGLCMNVGANLLFVSELTVGTPAHDLYAILLLHGISLGMLLLGTTNVLLGHEHFRFIGFGMTIYFSFRQLGGALGVAATVALVDIRETLHSSRLFDTANRLNPIARRVLSHLGLLLHAKGLPTNIAHGGSFRLFQGLVLRQTALLSFIDVFWCLALLGAAGIVLTLVFANRRHGRTAPVPSVYQYY